MQITNSSQNSYNPSFNGLYTSKMSKQCKEAIREKILPKINSKLVDELDIMGYDIVFKRGGGVEGSEIDLFLRDRTNKELNLVERLNLKYSLKNLSKKIIKCFTQINKN